MWLWPFGRKKKAVAAPDSPPVPTHLKPFIKLQPGKDGALQLTGSIRCTCGCIAFSAYRNQDDDSRFRLVCRNCDQDILLFDARQHGWDTVVCHVPVEDAQAGETAEVCPACGSNSFGVTVWIEPASREEFVSCVEGELPDEEWVNAFTWFAAHLTCVGCGKKQRDWADVETA